MTGNGINGIGPGGPSNVASLEEARRRASDRKRREASAAQPPVERASLRDWVVGIVIIMLAGAAIWQWLSPAFRHAFGT